MPAVGVSDDGEVAVEETTEEVSVPWSGPGAWDVAGTGRSEVTGTVGDPEAREQEQRAACGQSYLLWMRHGYDWAYDAVQRCREQGLLTI